MVVYNLIEQLVKLGHDVTLIGTGDSQTSAKLIPIFERCLRNHTKAEAMSSFKIVGLGKVLSFLMKNDFDIIHNHIGWRFIPFIEALKKPVVTTLHGPLDIGYQREVYSEYKRENYVSISLNQQKPMADLNIVDNVYNGIDMEGFKFSKGGDYFMFLGRMSPEKGPVQAIQVAKKAGVKLLMAAKIDATDKVYYEKEVKPLIDGKQIKYVGEIGHEEKVKLLGGAKALLAPIQWEEPFGLVFIEAMACGTPVMTLDRGSVREIILDKKTGFICKDLDEMVSKIPLLDKIDRELCHVHVSKNFSSVKMANDYLNLYKKVLSS